MKLEKRSGGEAEDSPVQEPAASRKKPVVVYIMILFIVAFLLMALSFFMHQRSNTEALGELQHSVSALQEVQATQDKNIQLQEELSTANDELDSLKNQLAESREETLAAQEVTDAMLALYTLQQQYSAADYDACALTIQSMENHALVELLPTDTGLDITSPAMRYQQLKEAVLNH
jgi:septal ring factor EnvC (AmiA/AmiB activator)